jgi:hypothetical protein
LRVGRWELRVESWELGVGSWELGVESSELRVESWELRVESLERESRQSAVAFCGPVSRMANEASDGDLPRRVTTQLPKPTPFRNAAV